MKRQPHLGMHRLLVKANSQSADKVQHPGSQALQPRLVHSHSKRAAADHAIIHACESHGCC